MRRGYSVTVFRLDEPILTIDAEMLSGKAGLSDEDEAAIREAGSHILSFIGPEENPPCFACGGVEECEDDCPLRAPLNMAE